MNKIPNRLMLVALGAGLLFFSTGLYLAHGETTAPTTTTYYGSKPTTPTTTPTAPSTPAPVETPASTSNDSSGLPPAIWPRTAHSSPKMRLRESKTCREYLSICERSCQDRGSMFRFSCIGQDFQPFDRHFRCQCADDMEGGALQVRMEREQ